MESESSILVDRIAASQRRLADVVGQLSVEARPSTIIAKQIQRCKDTVREITLDASGKPKPIVLAAAAGGVIMLVASIGFAIAGRARR